MFRRLPALAATVTIVTMLGAAPSALAVSGDAGPAIPGTERPQTVVTVTAPGDLSSAVMLRTPLTVGATASSTGAVWDRATETYRDGGEVSTSEWEFTDDRVGTDTVVDVRPDGSFRVWYRQESGEQSVTYSNPDHENDLPDPAVVDGVALFVEYDPARQSVGAFADPEDPMTDAEIAYYTDTSFAMTIPVPAEPVGVGATWTWTAREAMLGAEFDVSMTARLDAITGDRYAASVAYSADIAGTPGLELDPAVAAVRVGTYSGTIAVDGSISNPLDYHQRQEVQYRFAIDLAEGWSYEVEGNSTSEYTEVPNATGAIPVATSTPPSPTVPVSPTAPVATATVVDTAPTTQLVDATGVLTVAVPTTWTSTNTAFVINGRPGILASTDLAVFSPTGTIPSVYTAPGVMYFAVEPIPFDPAEAATFLPFEGCTELAPTPYADGTFTGSVIIHEACNGTPSRVAVLAANRDDGAMGIMVVVVLTDPGNAVLDAVLASLDGDPSS